MQTDREIPGIDTVIRRPAVGVRWINQTGEYLLAFVGVERGARSLRASTQPPADIVEHFANKVDHGAVIVLDGALAWLGHGRNAVTLLALTAGLLSK